MNHDDWRPEGMSPDTFDEYRRAQPLRPPPMPTWPTPEERTEMMQQEDKIFLAYADAAAKARPVMVVGRAVGKSTDLALRHCQIAAMRRYAGRVIDSGTIITSAVKKDRSKAGRGADALYVDEIYDISMDDRAYIMKLAERAPRSIVAKLQRMFPEFVAAPLVPTLQALVTAPAYGANLGGDAFGE